MGVPKSTLGSPSWRCMYTCIYIYVDRYIYICIHVYTHISIYIYVYIYISLSLSLSFDSGIQDTPLCEQFRIRRKRGVVRAGFILNLRCKV